MNVFQPERADVGELEVSVFLHISNDCLSNGLADILGNVSRYALASDARRVGVLRRKPNGGRSER